MKNELTERSQQIQAACDTKSQKSETKMELIADLPEGYSCYVTRYDFGTGAWSYLKIEIFTLNGDSIVFYRNYPSFPHIYVRQNNMDYLITSEDYQGYTVVNLTKCTVRTILHPGREKGWGWCPVEFHYYDEIDGLLDVEGCYWGAEFEHRRYIVEDFDTFNFDEFETIPVEYEDEDEEDLEEDEE